LSTDEHERTAELIGWWEKRGERKKRGRAVFFRKGNGDKKSVLALLPSFTTSPPCGKKGAGEKGGRVS